MDFKEYYLNQAEKNFSNYPVFRGGVYNQRGYGLGGFFRRFFNWALPLLRQHGAPIAKSVGKEIITNVADIAHDALEGRDIKESAKRKFTNSLEKLTQSQQDLQKGSGLKRKKKNKSHTNSIDSLEQNLKTIHDSKKSKKKKQHIFDIFGSK